MRILSCLLSAVMLLTSYTTSAQSLTQLATSFSAVIDSAAEAEFPVLIQESSYSYEKTLHNLRQSINGNNFRLIREQQLVAGLDLQQTSDYREQMVYFCNFNKVNQVLRIDKRIGQFLPCRVTVVEHQGKVYVMAINPKFFGKFFANEKLIPVCDEITAMFRQIINEATF